jgi:hypothetical protein
VLARRPREYLAKGRTHPPPGEELEACATISGAEGTPAGAGGRSEAAFGNGVATPWWKKTTTRKAKQAAEKTEKCMVPAIDGVRMSRRPQPRRRRRGQAILSTPSDHFHPSSEGVYEGNREDGTIDQGRDESGCAAAPGTS